MVGVARRKGRRGLAPINRGRSGTADQVAAGQQRRVLPAPAQRAGHGDGPTDPCGGRRPGPAPGGTFDIGETTTSAGSIVPADPEEAAAAVSGDEFVFDVQGHFLQYPEGTGFPLPGFPQDDCGTTDPHDCYSAETFFDLMFDQSDHHDPHGAW